MNWRRGSLRVYLVLSVIAWIATLSWVTYEVWTDYHRDTISELAVIYGVFSALVPVVAFILWQLYWRLALPGVRSLIFWIRAGFQDGK